MCLLNDDNQGEDESDSDDNIENLDHFLQLVDVRDEDQCYDLANEKSVFEHENASSGYSSNLTTSKSTNNKENTVNQETQSSLQRMMSIINSEQSASLTKKKKNHKSVKNELSDFQSGDPYQDNLVFTNDNKFWLAIWVTLAKCPDVPKHLLEDIQKVIMNYQEVLLRITSSAGPKYLFIPPTLKELVKDMVSMLKMKDSKPTVKWCPLPSGNIIGIVIFQCLHKIYSLMSDVRLIQFHNVIFAMDLLHFSMKKILTVGMTFMNANITY